VGGGAQIPWSPELLGSVLALAAALALGIGSILWIRRWRQRYTAERPDPGENLEHFRSLFAQGQLTREELDRIEQLFTASEKPDSPPAGPTLS
jgi:hypothetical protein